jgi:ornithine decarboxylase
MTETARIDRFFAERNPPTPCIVVDREIVRARYKAMAALFPAASIYYAVKANPAPEVIAAIAKLGANFDLASEGERRRCQDLGIPSDRLSFGNTIKRESEIAAAYGAGIRLFAFDAIAELEKLARSAPGAGVFCRLLAEGHGAEWPLSRKFGCAPEMAVDLLCRAKGLGLRPLGVSFHVGSQQTEPKRWADEIAVAAEVFRACAKAGLALELLNLGGGFPAQYRSAVPPLAAYAATIEEALTQHFGGARPRIFVEPGRYLVGDAGILRATVLLVAHKSPGSRQRWVYLDAGLYNGLPETAGERIHYRIRTPHNGGPDASAVLAGPTCDSADIIYQRSGYRLPVALAVGDPVDFLSAGAYTASYAAVEFNGFAPIRTYCI